MRQRASMRRRCASRAPRQPVSPPQQQGKALLPRAWHSHRCPGAAGTNRSPWTARCTAPSRPKPRPRAPRALATPAAGLAMQKRRRPRCPAHAWECLRTARAYVHGTALTHRVCQQRSKVHLACTCSHGGHREACQRRRYTHARAHRRVGGGVDAGRRGAVRYRHLSAKRACIVDLHQQRSEHEAEPCHYRRRASGPAMSVRCG